MSGATKGRRPNVILLVLDSVRADHLSCYGHARPTSPHIDRVAEAGITYDRAYTASCWTLPSHASLFTGLYPSRHRTDFDTKALTEGIETCASFLSGQGYATASFSCNAFVSRHTDLARGFDVAADVEGLMGGGPSFMGRAVRAAHRTVRRTLQKDRGAERAWRMARRWLSDTGDRPFFMFMNFMDCHLPYRLAPEHLLQFVDPARRGEVARVPMDPFGAMAGKHAYSPQDVEDLKAMYDGALRYLDGMVGALDAHLAALGRKEDTLLIITSDHGESFGEHGLFDHQYGLYEPLVRVPLVVRGPDLDAGRREHGLAQLVDVFPSIARMLGRDGPVGDHSASDTLFTDPGRDFAASEYLVPNVAAIQRRFPGTDTSRFESAIRSVRDDRYKCIVRRDGRTELYDLEGDPEELHNLYERDPERATRMVSLLEDRLGPWPSDLSAGKEGGLDPLRERLEQLGYL